MLIVGDHAPDFSAPTDAGTTVSLSDFRGKKVVLYFYPKDDTPGCTREAWGFRDQYQALLDHGAVVLGVSIDGVESHARFKAKYQLPFQLVSDESKAIVSAYGVWKEKNLYGRTYMGTERTTFVLDEAGIITHIFPKVQVDGHVVQVLAALGGAPQQLPLVPVEIPAPVQMALVETPAPVGVPAKLTRKKPARKKPSAKKAAPKRPVRRKPAAKKAAPKKAAAKKTTRSKRAPKRPARRRPAAKQGTRKSTRRTRTRR